MNTRFRKVVHGPFTGAQFEIAKISMKQYMEVIGDLPLSISAAVRDDITLLQQAEKLTGAEADDLNRRSTELILTQGVRRIRFSDEEEWAPIEFWFGSQETCPPGATMIGDLGSDLDVLVDQVGRFSFNIQGGDALERFFREAGGLIAGLSGEAIQPEAVKPAPSRDDLN